MARCRIESIDKMPLLGEARGIQKRVNQGRHMAAWALIKGISMKFSSMSAAAALFVLAAQAAFAAQKIAPSQYHDKDKQEAARALLEVAKVQAGKGSWERIAIGRIYYLGGF